MPYNCELEHEDICELIISVNYRISDLQNYATFKKSYGEEPHPRYYQDIEMLKVLQKKLEKIRGY